MLEQQYAMSGRKGLTIGEIEVDGEDVRVPMTMKYADARSFTQGSLNELMVSHARIDKTDEGKLRLTLSSGEAFVTTFAGWKQQQVRKPQGDRTAVIKLDDALPGASLVVYEVSKSDQENEALASQGFLSLAGTVALELRGPAEVKTLNVQVGAEGSDRSGGNSYPMFDETREIDGVHIRRMSIQYSDWLRGQTIRPALLLTVRRPQDLKRERVKFDLTAIDLF